MQISEFELLILLLFSMLFTYFIFNDYVDSAISTWHRTQGKVENIKVIYVPPFAGSPSRGKYYVSASALYEFNNIEYICEASPYSLWYTESKEHADYLKIELGKNNTVEIYVDRNAPSKSIFIFGGFRSWSEIQKSYSLINV